MSKKNTIILMIIAAILVLALGIFLLFFTAPSIQNPNGQNNNSPFGNYFGSSSTTPETGDGLPVDPSASTTTYINKPTSPLIKISTTPIVGAEVFDRKLSGTTTSSIVRYMERSSGRTSEYDNSTYTLTKSSNTLGTSFYDAKWSGNTVLAQYLEKNTIKTLTGSLPATTSPTTELKSVVGLASNIYTMAISPKGDRVFTITGGSSAIGNISNLDGSKNASILNFPFNEWISQWPNEKTITLTTKPSYSTQGFMYFLSTAGVMTKAFGNIAGLTTLTSPSLGHTIYSTSNANGISTSVYDFSKNASFSFTNKHTFPEKCVWSKLSKTTIYCAMPVSIPIGNYPDDWYQGNVSFVDNIYKIDLNIPIVSLIYKLPTDQSIDAINLFLDAKEENLYFTNKNDYYLWGLRVKDLTPISF